MKIRNWPIRRLGASLLMMGSCWFSAVSQGQAALEESGFHVLVPHPKGLSVELFFQQQAPKCNKIFSYIESLRKGLEKCEANFLEEDNNCQLIRDMLSVNVEHVVSRDPVRYLPYYQHSWLIDLHSDEVSDAEVAAFAKSKGINKDQVILGEAASHKVEKLHVVGKPDSYTYLLQSMNGIDWGPVIFFDSESDGRPMFGTMDSLTACELLSGKVLVEAVVKTDFTYGSMDDGEGADLRWEFHQQLVEASKGWDFSPFEMAARVGFEFAEFQKSHPKVFQSDAKDMLDAHLGGLGVFGPFIETVEVQNYENKYQLFSRMSTGGKTMSSINYAVGVYDEESK